MQFVAENFDADIVEEWDPLRSNCRPLRLFGSFCDGVYRLSMYGREKKWSQLFEGDYSSSSERTISMENGIFTYRILHLVK